MNPDNASSLYIYTVNRSSNTLQLLHLENSSGGFAANPLQMQPIQNLTGGYVSVTDYIVPQPSGSNFNAAPGTPIVNQTCNPASSASVTQHLSNPTQSSNNHEVSSSFNPAPGTPIARPRSPIARSGTPERRLGSVIQPQQLLNTPCYPSSSAAPEKQTCYPTSSAPVNVPYFPSPAPQPMNCDIPQSQENQNFTGGHVSNHHELQASCSFSAAPGIPIARPRSPTARPETPERRLGSLMPNFPQPMDMQAAPSAPPQEQFTDNVLRNSENNNRRNERPPFELKIKFQSLDQSTPAEGRKCSVLMTFNDERDATAFIAGIFNGIFDFDYEVVSDFQ